MLVTLCDWRDEKGNPCGERADVTVTMVWEGKKYEADLCSQLHAKSLTANAREATGPTLARENVTRLPRVEAGNRKKQEQLVEQIDYPDLRAWLEAQGDLPAGSRGRVKQSLQQKWLDAGEPRPV